MKQPQVDIEVAPNTWETARGWPLPNTKPIDFYLQGTAAGFQGHLGSASGESTDSLTFTDANLSETNYESLTNSQANKAMFLSPPLTQDMRISGTPQLDIWASLSKTQTNLSAFLVDYGGGVLRVLRTNSEGVHNRPRRPATATRPRPTTAAISTWPRRRRTRRAARRRTCRRSGASRRGSSTRRTATRSSPASPARRRSGRSTSSSGRPCRTTSRSSPATGSA